MERQPEIYASKGILLRRKMFLSLKNKTEPIR